MEVKSRTRAQRKRTTPDDSSAKPAIVSSSDGAAFVERLRILIDRRGSVLGLATSAGLKNSSIHLWLGGSEPSREKLVKLADAAGVTVEWLAAGRGPMRADLLPEGWLLVPRLKGSSKVIHEGVDYLALKKDWILSLPGSPDSDALLLIEAVGDAMAPYIESRDLVLINARDRKLRDGVWALMTSEVALGIAPILIRRVRAEGSETFRLLCDNKSFESAPRGQPFRFIKTKKGAGADDFVGIESEDGQIFGILGRVIWKGGNVR